MRYALIVIALMACGPTNEKRGIITLEYDSHSSLCVENGRYYMVSPAIEEEGSITIHDDSVLFRNKSGDVDRVLRVMSISGDPQASRVVCMSDMNEDIVLLISKQSFKKRYNMHMLMVDSGHYFDVHNVR